MKATSSVRMAMGNGDNSYAANSRLQVRILLKVLNFGRNYRNFTEIQPFRPGPEKAILETRPVLSKAIEDVYTSLSARQSTIVVADLGCSSGPNTLLVVSEVIRACAHKSEEREHGVVEVQFFLNDLPGNDFNLVFRSLEHFENSGGQEAPPHYVAGLPGSYYGKLFPRQSVHLFHSSYSLMWRSKVPLELSSCSHVNEGNIYIGKSTPPSVIKLFQEQFRKDFELFLTLRSRELVNGGRMLLTFIGRKSEEMMMHGDVTTVFELVAKSLLSLVQKGRVKKEKLDSFNLPYYAPSVKEVKALINKNGLFNIEHIKLFESNWDPQDDSEGDVVLDCTNSGANVAKCIRAVLEPLIVDHFGKDIIEELFMVYASIVAKHVEKSKAKYPIIMVSLKKVMN